MEQDTKFDLGRLRKLEEAEVRKIWPREQQDLSVWMKDNIDALNEALGLRIEIAETEAPVGNFRLDLAGNEVSTQPQRPAVIENQFGKTDHDHLGKLITYAAGREAGILIWVASEFQAPHRSALEWLNKISGEDMLFYGIELEVFQIDDSKPAPKFTLIAEPPAEKRPRADSDEPSVRALSYKEFWGKFLNHLKANHPGITRASIPQAQNWFSISAGVSGFGIGASFTGDGRFRVELYIDTGNKEQNKSAFAQLKESEGSIHEEIGDQLDWDELPDRRASRISLPRTGSIDDTPEKHQEYILWGTEQMAKFREVFKPYLENLTLP